jgi:hypothetical protein
MGFYDYLLGFFPFFPRFDHFRQGFNDFSQELDHFLLRFYHFFMALNDFFPRRNDFFPRFIDFLTGREREVSSSNATVETIMREKLKRNICFFYIYFSKNFRFGRICSDDSEVNQDRYELSKKN